MEKKVILITGAASGIGNYIAMQYIKMFHDVICIDINDIDITNCQTYKCDLSNEDSVHALFSKISKIDFAINCAGVSSVRKSLIDFSGQELINALAVNLLPSFNSSELFYIILTIIFSGIISFFVAVKISKKIMVEK